MASDRFGDILTDLGAPIQRLGFSGNVNLERTGPSAGRLLSCLELREAHGKDLAQLDSAPGILMEGDGAGALRSLADWYDARLRRAIS